MRRVAWASVVALLLVAAGLGIWLGLRGGSSTASPRLGPTTAGAARSGTPLARIAVTAGALKAHSSTLAQDVYWLGPERGRRYGLERAADGNVFVRYLAGDTHDTTTVGTYPLENAYAATGAFAAEHGWAREHVEAWLVVVPASSRTEVYLAAQGFPYQIEVYDPTPGRARALVESGAVTPVR